MTVTMWKTVVVTGGEGFIGSNLIEHLLKHNIVERIVCLDNRSSGHYQIDDSRVKYVYGNTWDINSLLPGEEPEVLFHFGEFSRIVTSFEKIQYVFMSNSLGTQRVLDYCVSKNAKLIYSGSSSIYGNNENDSNLSPYAFLKKQSVTLIKNYSKWFGLRYVITAFFNIYGPRDLDTGDYATCIGIFRRQYTASQPLTVVHPGTQRRIWTHVNDVVNGVILCAERGDGDGYKLFSDDNLSILEVVGAFKDARFVMIPERKGERFQSIVESSRARDELCWSPKYRLHDYVQSFVGQGAGSNGHAFENGKDPHLVPPNTTECTALDTWNTFHAQGC